MSVNQRILSYHVARLKDRNPDVRLKSIHELKLLADPQVLDALEEVYRTDANADVRRAAQEAGRVIFLKQQTRG